MKDFFMVHLQALLFSLGQQIRTPFSSLLTIAVLSISIALSGIFYLAVKNITHLTGHLESSNQITLFLGQQVSDQDGRWLLTRLEKHRNIQSTRLITKTEGLKDFEQFSGFGDALKALSRNPLPMVIQVFPRLNLTTPQQLQQLLDELKAMPEVAVAKIDMQWVQRLKAIIVLAERSVLVLASILAFAVIFITGNTIRLELQNRQEEVVIAKLVGATNGFIARPFLYSGFWYGLLAGLLAWLMITGLMALLQSPMEQLMTLYLGYQEVVFLSVLDSVILLVVSAALGVLGAWGVLVSQLSRLTPE
ncbi:MAG: permease-like cell division protein FtsX [Methylococcales bacterium]|jgi:cell division transport system permease protein|nr:FtsX-like permease family protein [Methylococcales bacterium]